MANYKFNIGDFVETRDGKVGYINEICHCNNCKACNFYELTVLYTNGEKDYISNYSVQNIEKEYKRIGKYDFSEADNSIVDKIMMINMVVQMKDGTFKEIRVRQMSDYTVEFTHENGKIAKGSFKFNDGVVTIE